MRKITLARVQRAELDLQSVVDVPRQHRQRILRAMAVLNEIGMKMRHEAIFAAGARAKTPTPKFEGEQLGSSESMTFYDGFASTHPDFLNPYRHPRKMVTR